MTQPSPAAPAPVEEKDPWPALFALCLGFFMILVDTTIVSVATPAIIDDLDADVNDVVWVTSAYLLAYAVPVLITGRLGDRFGPKNLYITGLAVFTLASLWCGLTGSVEMLILARVVQGLGASMITPQTMAIITRIFPAARRGRRWRCGARPRASRRWSARSSAASWSTASAGSGSSSSTCRSAILGFVLAVRLVPTLATHTHRFDWLGRRAERRRHVPAGLRDPGGPPVRLGRLDHLAMIVGGVVVMVAFVVWQARNRAEPLVPLGLFRDRNFSLANVAITVMGFTITAMALPAHALRPAGARAEPHQVGAAARADGGHVDPAGPPDRHAHRPRPPAADPHRVRVRACCSCPAVDCPTR